MQWALRLKAYRTPLNWVILENDCSMAQGGKQRYFVPRVMPGLRKTVTHTKLMLCWVSGYQMSKCPGSRLRSTDRLKVFDVEFG